MNVTACTPYAWKLTNIASTHPMAYTRHSVPISPVIHAPTTNANTLKRNHYLSIHMMTCMHGKPATFPNLRHWPKSVPCRGGRRAIARQSQCVASLVEKRERALITSDDNHFDSPTTLYKQNCAPRKSDAFSVLWSGAWWSECKSVRCCLG
jgi:hypothetical protein